MFENRRVRQQLRHGIRERWRLGQQRLEFIPRRVVSDEDAPISEFHLGRLDGVSDDEVVG